MITQQVVRYPVYYIASYVSVIILTSTVTHQKPINTVGGYGTLTTYTIYNTYNICIINITILLTILLLLLRQ